MRVTDTFEVRRVWGREGKGVVEGLERETRDEMGDVKLGEVLLDKKVLIG